jgi:hypothetical protein
MISSRQITTHIRKDNDVFTYRLVHKPTGQSVEVHSLDFEACKSQCEKDLEDKLGELIERHDEA